MKSLSPNVILSDPPTHYISYNNTDVIEYGRDTTAIVVKSFEDLTKYNKPFLYSVKFLILNGKHNNLIDKALEYCLTYFKKIFILKISIVKS